MNTSELIAVIITSVFASGGFWSFLQTRMQKKDDRKEELRNISAGLMYLLRKDLIDRCEKWLDEDHVPLHEWDSIRAEHQVYNKLGGNSDVDARFALLEDKIRDQMI